MKKLIALLLTAAIALSLCACGGSGNSTSMDSGDLGDIDRIQDIANKNNITDMANYPFDETRKSTANSDERYPFVDFAQSLSPKEMQPYNLQDNAKAYIKNLVYEFLYDRVGAEELQGRLAKDGYEEDELHYVVELYDNITDSDGNNITASDVVFSYELNKDSGYAYLFSKYESAEAIDKYKVRFTWNAPLDSLGDKIWLLANVAIVSEKAYKEHDFSKAPVTTGPYKVTSFVTDSYCELEARDDYWQTPELRSNLAGDNVQTIRIEFVTDSSMRMILLENGTSICNPYLAATDIDAFLEGGEYAGVFNLTTSYSTQSSTLLPNMSDESIMKDINMRLAVWYAINTAGVVTGLGQNAYTGCVVDAASSVGDYQEDWNQIESYQTEWSIEKSKEYQELAGYNGEPITILCGTFASNKNAVQIIAEMLRQAGINTNISIFEHVMEAQYLQDPSAWDLFLIAEAATDYCINFLNIKYSIDSPKAGVEGVNVSLIHDETLESMIDKCLTVDGYSTELTEEILQYIIDNAYGYALTYMTSYVAWNKDVAKPVCPYGNTTQPLFNCCDYYLD